MQYLEQNCKLTLHESLEEYNKNYSFLNPNDGHDEASKWFRNHDITHILFGTIPFEIRGEAINDTWTLVGTNVTLKGYKKFLRYVDYKTVINSYKRKYKYTVIIYLVTLSNIPICLLTIFRAYKMSKKWNWYNYDEYLNIPLSEIRKEFNIKVIKP
ncbi:hypothetical protein IBE48_04865 [Francisella philomiragia]|uniref:Coenzyme Q (Ubiquinone) biosynthesis protein Coq4 n=1 Tax=Francisella philomiragia TaxID=28110 RepID=A0AAW3DB82_9GAMM|nr:hypothetical protein [Francisella philomiragia]KFJ42773.1 hypothetical protein DR78_899 [Francisella philomiragia]MBK2254023.1 hypothetical protein [Francisella philomiragia]MBK2272335.1 hypothetical protein [Francisella philomiragia]MBK2276177.1 hypothetical protein [Francisella philomiragia]MBK2280124.1 hypothetical protein [Francisella philomiragia]